MSAPRMPVRRHLTPEQEEEFRRRFEALADRYGGRFDWHHEVAECDDSEFPHLALLFPGSGRDEFFAELDAWLDSVAPMGGVH